MSAAFGVPEGVFAHNTFYLAEIGHSGAGLPDGIFSNQKPNLGKFWSVLQ
jgi:hypothetical protein